MFSGEIRKREFQAPLMSDGFNNFRFIYFFSLQTLQEASSWHSLYLGDGGQHEFLTF